MPKVLGQEGALGSKVSADKKRILLTQSGRFCSPALTSKLDEIRRSVRRRKYRGRKSGAVGEGR